MRVYGLVFVCLSWLALLSGVASSSNDNNGVCKLGDEAAAVLCAIAHLVEKAKEVADSYDLKDIEETWGNVQLHKEVVDHRVKNLPDIIERAKGNGVLTSQDAGKLEEAYREAHKKNTEQYEKAQEAKRIYNDAYKTAKDVTSTALGDGKTRQNCKSTASLLDIIQCHVKGEQSQGSSVSVSDVCNRKDYKQVSSVDVASLLTNCEGIGKSKKYCNGTGAALKEALEKWESQGTNNTDSRNIGNCNVKNDWEKHAQKAKDHMLTLDQQVQVIHDANLLTTAYFSVVDKMRDDVEKGKPMKEILENARKAGKEGAVVLVAKPHPSTGENATAASETGGSDKVEEEVKVNVKLDGLQFDEDESSLANSKDKFPKYYVYLLAVLVPVCSIALAVAIFCIIRRTKPAHAEKGIPVEGAAAGKSQDGGKTASF
ncbi:unnamed protein product [Trypanosoma congolense IL3000]|uniref:WGS project CAEQ00000000 data, annotated contig 1730 n=1 Tax=Trypanosoma congolense (strain IL3000) TaxID=1068625 RepID=F9W8D9_TRYCI|nr:unnamed protein product [Trypanosoma congolense IL3000]